MSILIALVVGVLVGAAIGMILPKGTDLFILNIVCGLAGSILGLGTYYFLSVDALSSSLFSARALLLEVLGAALLTVFFNTVNLLATRRNDG